MAKGDVQDFVNRLNKLLPPWFGEEYPLLTALLTGYATMDSYIYMLTEYLKAQMRIPTATGENLDLIACDFYEGILQRFENMDDEVFRKMILASLLQEQATKQGMIDAITTLTGNAPLIFEPFDPASTGAYNVDTWGYNDGGAYGGNAPYNFWITVYVNEDPMKNFGCFNSNTWGYNGGGLSNGYYGGNALYILTYDEILAVVNRVKVGATIAHLTVIYI